MRIRSSQMIRREAISIGQDSCLRLVRRQHFLFPCLVVVTVTLGFSPVVAGAAEDVSFRDIGSAAQSSLCVPSMVLTFCPTFGHRGRGHYNAVANYSLPRRPRSLAAHIQSRVVVESQGASWSLREKLHQQRGRHQRSQHGPEGRRREQDQQQRYGALFLSHSGLRPTARECDNFSRVTRGYFQQTSPKPPLCLTVTATVGHPAKTEQRWILSRQYSTKKRSPIPSILTAEEAIRSTSCRLSSEGVAEPPNGRLFGEESRAGYSTDVNAAGVASLLQRTRPVQPGAEKLRGDEQHPYSAPLQEEHKPFVSSVEHVSCVPSESSGGRLRLEERRQSDTVLTAGAEALANSGAKRSLTCVPRNPVEEESSSPCGRDVGKALQENEAAVAGVAFPFPRLGLFPNFVEALTHFGVYNATEIQQLGLPAIFSGADVVLGAETGSGKTLGYLLGILQNVLIQKMIHERKEDEAMMEKDDLPLPRHYPYAIIVVPTRELALQVAAWSRRLCRKTPICTQLLLGSYARWPFGTLTLPTSPDVILCTPQVLAGFTRGGGYKRKHSLFEQTQMLVIDEADMLLEGGYKKMMELVFLEFRKSDKILAGAGKRRTQYVFAAATIPERGPVSIRKTIGALCPGASFLCTNSLHHQRRELQQEFVEIGADASFDDKINLLLDKLQEIPVTERVMIFCNTAQTAKKVLQVLEKTLPAAANPKLFSSDLDQRDRARNLGLFAREKSRVLVCTDAASRGLDLVGVTSVIQFDFSSNAVTHLHRVGRVARAGKLGRAINFYEPVSKPLVDAVRQAAYDPTRKSLADAFSRKRSFRKSLKKAENSSVALVVDYTSAVDVNDAASS